MALPLQLSTIDRAENADVAWPSVYAPNPMPSGLPILQPFGPRSWASPGIDAKTVRAAARAALIGSDFTGELSQFEHRGPLLGDVDIHAALAFGERSGEVIAARLDLADLEAAVAPGAQLHLVGALAAQRELDVLDGLESFSRIRFQRSRRRRKLAQVEGHAQPRAHGRHHRDLVGGQAHADRNLAIVEADLVFGKRRQIRDEELALRVGPADLLVVAKDAHIGNAGEIDDRERVDDGPAQLAARADARHRAVHTHALSDNVAPARELMRFADFSGEHAAGGAPGPGHLAVARRVVGVRAQAPSHALALGNVLRDLRR